ncbi:TetR/AcrR family transcriptional regulator [Rhizobium sp. TRM95796]|uniref:TetR/AcrR family transcriptional regulator n=1 Tax=Rhizobium sp. TRM95796 TaxID=2979862 RepID=UPI0021E70B54|nr:TetR/AcrR family transcriptional regulator [Rhizobium sp. TRM95796]MCV3767792.1 TetR/AcrR family transcriptional regulator [Rhizobium sp. TRM95796]
MPDDTPTLQEHSPESYTTERLCQRMLERHRDIIRVQKDHLAVKKLVKIVAAALELSNRLGFHAMSLRDLSRESGVSMGGLYSYFDSKTTLLSMILTEVASTASEALGQAPAEIAGDPALHLEWLISTHIRLTEAMQPWFVFAFMEAKTFPQPARRLATESEETTEKIFADVIARGVELTVFATPHPDLTASLVKPLLQDWYVKRSKYRRRGVSVDDYTAAVSSFVKAAVGVCPGEARFVAP